MMQNCRFCGASYHVNMGLYGIADNKKERCSHCGTLIFSASGEVVQETPKTAKTPEAPPRFNSITVEKQAVHPVETSPPAVTGTGNKRKSRFATLLFSFFIAWAICALVTFLGELVYFAYLLQEGIKISLIEVAKLFIITLFMASLSVLFFYLFRQERRRS